MFSYAPPASDQIVALVKAEFAQAKLYLRAYDRRHSIRLRQAEVDYSVRETFESALRLAEKVLLAHGTPEEKVVGTIADVRERDLDRLQQQAEGGLQSGLERLHVAPVRPEPLSNLD